jgi:hypothetical protein
MTSTSASTETSLLAQIEEAIAAHDIERLRDTCEAIELEFAFHPNPYTAPLQHQQQQQHHQQPSNTLINNVAAQQPDTDIPTPEDTTTIPVSVSSPTNTASPSQIQPVPTPHVNAEIAPYDPRIYTLLLLSHLHLSDLPSARHVYLRTPPGIQANTDYAHLVSVLTHLYAGHYGPAIEILETVIFSPGYAGPLIQGLVSSIRERSLKLLGRVYDSLDVEKAAAALGLRSKSKEDVVAYLKSEKVGWVLEDGWLKPPVGLKTAHFEKQLSEEEKERAKGMAQLSNLADYVLHLER